MPDRSEAAPGLLARELRYAAAVLASIVAGIHLFHPTFGAPRLIRHVQLGTIFDPRPLLFTASAFLVVFGILLVYHGLYVRSVYLLGMALMLVHLLGYVAWHTVLDHGAFWPYIEAHGHTDAGTFEVVWTHLVNDTAALVSKVAEFALLVVLAALYRNDVPQPPDRS